MFKCPHCPFSGSLELFCKHIRLWHSKHSYVCGQNGCKRSYFNINVLKLHLKSKHTEAEIVSVACSSLNQTSAELSQISEVVTSFLLFLQADLSKLLNLFSKGTQLLKHFQLTGKFDSKHRNHITVNLIV